MTKDLHKTILILTAKFGAGHMSAAHAIKNDLLRQYPSFSILIKNFMDSNLSFIDKPMIKFYEGNTKYTPSIYNYYYYLKKTFDSKNAISHKLLTPKLSKYILEIKPDLIISTFPLAAACVHNFKNEYPNYKIPSITVLTDVVDSLEWVYPNTNMYFVPSNEIRNRFVQNGIHPDDVKVTGIPIDSSFDCDSKIKIKDKCRLLFMGGGRGLFDISEEFMYWMDSFIDFKDDRLEITIVTGKNKRLYTNLTKKRPLKNIKVLGFVNNMNELLRNNDVIFTKPGGATLFESIRSNTPIIVKLPKIGQEIENARFITDKGIGMIYQNEKDVKNILINLSQGKLDSMLNFMEFNIVSFNNMIYPNDIPKYINTLINNKD